MAVENPPPLTPFAGEAPQRAERATFSPRVDKFVTWLIAVVLQLKMIILNVMHNANEAYLAASAAVGSQALAASNASAAGAAAGEAQDAAQLATARALSAANAQAQAAGSASAAQADAGVVTQMGASVLAHAALAGLPALAGRRLKGVRVNADETGLELAEFVTAVKSYMDRADLRAISGGVLATRYLVRQLGLFEWLAGSSEPDDDATCFRTAGGAWLMISADPDFAASLWESEMPTILRSAFSMTLTTLVTGAGLAFIINVPGAMPGDAVVVTPGIQLSELLSVSSSVDSASVVRVAIGNPSPATRSLTPSTWTITIIKA